MVRRALASPKLVARTITAVRRQNAVVEDIQPGEGGARASLG
jgi:hypothetical protein